MNRLSGSRRVARFRDRRVGIDRRVFDRTDLVVLVVVCKKALPVGEGLLENSLP